MLLPLWSEQILFRCFCCRTFPQSSAGALKSEMSHRFWWKIEKFKSLISFISLFTCSYFCRWSNKLISIKMRNYICPPVIRRFYDFFFSAMIDWFLEYSDLPDKWRKSYDFFRKILPTRFFHLNKVLPTRFFVQIRVHQKKNIWRYFVLVQ